MSNATKTALETSLKKLLMHKKIDKITISDLTSDCGISRMAFYYHFKDIYDLVEWVCIEDGRRILQGKNTYDTWQEGMLQVFEAVLESKSFIQNVYHSISREKIENYLYKLTFNLISDVVEEKCVDTQLAPEDKAFIAEFYKFGFVGIMLGWIDRGMKDDYHEIVKRMSITLHGNITQSISNFQQSQKSPAS
ncbi:TetR/AcrR family transcriptional regulator [Parablautia muri]|uniref:TetR family transcriptional regulator n=1 Tax=Parablautia muri TaxID=2320879 RepID=A0A9X5BH62_9FIRM|nr:TetR/AcrR family transcriptional regulator [Parablautia muri]NBJ92857.1 TetR family transcriptional regulator [Parablautia muri]